MPAQKPKKVGRPKMAKGEAKGKIVPIRFNAEDLKKVTAAAKAKDQTVSEWVRNTLFSAIHTYETEVIMSEETAEERIKAGNWANCWICESVFQRRRETRRYCSKCHRGFCEGEHGNFAYQTGKCVICGAKKEDRK